MAVSARRGGGRGGSAAICGLGGDRRLGQGDDEGRRQEGDSEIEAGSDPAPPVGQYARQDGAEALADAERDGHHRDGGTDLRRCEGAAGQVGDGGDHGEERSSEEHG